MIRLLTLCFLLPGCATRVYGPDGRKQLETYADITNMDWKGPGTSLTGSRVNHSIPTRNAMTGVNGIVTEVAAAAITGGVR